MTKSDIVYANVISIMGVAMSKQCDCDIRDCICQPEEGIAMKTIQGRVVATCEKCGHEAPEIMVSRFGCPVCWEKALAAQFWADNPNATAREYAAFLKGE